MKLAKLSGPRPIEMLASSSLNIWFGGKVCSSYFSFPQPPLALERNENKERNEGKIQQNSTEYELYEYEHLKSTHSSLYYKICCREQLQPQI